MEVVSASVKLFTSTGLYILHAYANDSLGNIAHKSVTFTINTCLIFFVFQTQICLELVEVRPYSFGDTLIYSKRVRGIVPNYILEQKRKK